MKLGDLKLKHEMVLGADPDSEESREFIVDWIRASLSPGSPQYLAYRIHNAGDAGFPLEQDLVALSQKFTRNPKGKAGFQRRESAYWLSGMWSELIDRHAVCDAIQVARILASREPNGIARFRQRLSRLVVYFYPRIGVSLIIGYCSLLGAGPIRDYLAAIVEMSGGCEAPGGAYYIAAASALFISFIFSLIEVQRRTGGFRVGSVGRAAWMIGCGVGYSALCGLCHFWLKVWLRRGPCIPYIALISAMALAIGFAAQIFWRERAISEPM
jgi:hypothetical protein